MKLRLCILLSIMMISGSGCATQSWTEQRINEEKEKISKQLEEKHLELYENYRGETERNRKLIDLMKDIAKTAEEFKSQLENAKKDQAELAKTIKETEKQTVDSLEKFLRDGDAEVYQKVITVQQKLAEQLREEMKVVERAEKQARDLDDVIKKILEAYKKESGSKTGGGSPDNAK